ncbi:MAG: flagellar hook-length control protein FliK [Bdellovibrio sp.]
MLQNIVVGPMVGATDLKSLPEKTATKDFKGSGSDSSFGKALEEKISSAKDSKENKESPRTEMRQSRESKESDQSNQSKLSKEQKPQNSEAKKGPDNKVVKPEERVSKRSTVRQQKIKEFMDSFESEFEIPPTRLVEAMAQLDDTELAQTPEATADAVIDKLDLPEGDQDKARAMYAALLLQLNQPAAQAPSKPFAEVALSNGLPHQNMQERVMAAQNKQELMSASVDNLNKRFFSRETSVEDLNPAPMGPELAQNLEVNEDSFTDGSEQNPAMDSQQEVPQHSPVVAKPALAELPPHLQGQMKETISPSLLAALAAKQASAQNAEGKISAAATEEETPNLMDEFQQAVQSPKMAKPQMATGDALPTQGKVSQEFFQNQNSSQGQSWMQQNSKEFASPKSGEEKEILTKLTEKGASFKNSLTGLEGLQVPPIKGETLGMATPAPLAAAAAPAVANANENDAAVKHLMNQAQYLIKKGGGEMKVQMTPEGMGTIHLKVMLQDGKVNMQMSADTQEAKKTIESSLAELKTSLAAHKLSMENVKVDVVNSTSTDTATQNQNNNMNGNQQREQSRQFWNQFNENFGSQGRRESFTDMPNLKGYGQRNRDPLQPIETSVKASARSIEGKGSGINLVA